MNAYSILYTKGNPVVLHKTLHADDVNEVVHLMANDHDVNSYDIISINPRNFY